MVCPRLCPDSGKYTIENTIANNFNGISDFFPSLKKDAGEIFQAVQEKEESGG